MKRFVVLAALVLACSGRPTEFNVGKNTNETAARNFLKWYNAEYPKKVKLTSYASWNYATNITDENQKILIETSVAHQKFVKDELWKKAIEFAWTNFSDFSVKRQFEEITLLGSASLSDESMEEFSQLKARMVGIYSTTHVCPYKSDDKANCTLALEPDLTRILATSTDYDELLHAWVSWHDAAGKPNRENFKKRVEFSNKISKFDGYSDLADMWLSDYEDDNIEDEFERLWQQVQPLYLQLHAYVRRKLINRYGSDKIKADGPLPAHLLGNMWAQSWNNILKLTMPFPENPLKDVTEALIEQKYTPLKMFQLSDRFYQSMGFDPMTETFWNKSMIVKPADRAVTCHASAWDFHDGEDFRIKQCTEITMESLETVHHEMGHIQYYMRYKNQPSTFQSGANPGFHEAIGDLIAISVMSSNHFTKIGLLNETSHKETEINNLFLRALKKIAFLPFAYATDKWRRSVFRGTITPDEYNEKWWELRLKYQGIIPPVQRTEDNFDPAAKYHIASFTEYTRYFTAAILQLQFHKILCEISGHHGPLHTCDLYESKAAGERLTNMLQMGSSKPWQEAIKVLSGNKVNRMDAQPLIEFYRPLTEWLKEANKNEFVGWK